MLRSQDDARARSTATLRPDEWRLLVTSRPNVLLEGSDEITDAIVAEALHWLPKPQGEWTEGPPRLRPQTLIVRAVSSLDAGEQQRLLDWMVSPGHQVQVVSTTRKPIYQMVISGTFLIDLYYRLNVLLLNGARTQPS